MTLDILSFKQNDRKRRFNTFVIHADRGIIALRSFEITLNFVRDLGRFFIGCHFVHMFLEFSFYTRPRDVVCERLHVHVLRNDHFPVSSRGMMICNF